MRTASVRIWLSLIAGALLFSPAAAAQETPVNFTGWYGYEGYHPFGNGVRWGLFGEGYIKRNRYALLDPMQYFVRLGVNNSLKNGNRLTGGFAYQYNIPYDDASEPYNWPDYRIWEQFTIRKPGPKGMWVQKKDWRIETGYMFQQVFEGSDEATGHRRINHAFRLSLVSDAPFP